MSWIAALPMYDVPELRPQTDALWAALARAMAAEGLEGVPPALTRELHHRDSWVDERLLLGQTCGYPFATALAGRVQYVATPFYAVPECAGTYYTSRVVVRRDVVARSLDDLAGLVFAANEPDSHSGMNGPRALFAPVAHARGTASLFSRVIYTGGHRASLELLARAEADVAAIDSVTFALVDGECPDLTACVRDLAVTAPCPGPPLITSLRTTPDELRRIRAALVRLAADPDVADTRAALRLGGFDVLPVAAYDSVLELERAAQRLGYASLA